MNRKSVYIFFLSIIIIGIITMVAVINVVNHKYSSAGRKEVVTDLQRDEFSAISCSVIVNENLLNSYIYREENLSKEDLKEKYSFAMNNLTLEDYLKVIKEENLRAESFLSLLEEMSEMEKHSGNMSTVIEDVILEVYMESKDDVNYNMIIAINFEKEIIGIRDIKVKSDTEQEEVEIYYKLNNKSKELIEKIIKVQ